MKHFVFSILFATLITLTLSGCEEHGIFNCTKGKGSTIVEERAIGSFDRIEIRGGDIDLIITQAAEPSIVIEAQQNILDKVETRLSSGNLIIDIDGCVRNHETIKIWVENPDFHAIVIEGSADVVSTNPIVEEQIDLSISGSGDIELDLRVDDLNSDIDGSGDMRFFGTAEDHNINIDGSGDIKAIDMQSKDVDIKISGSGDVWVTANETLDVVINGSGDVHYKGYPTINSNIEGSGSIINEN